VGAIVPKSSLSMKQPGALKTRAAMRRSFLSEAMAAADAIDAGGAVYASEDVHAYIAKRAAGLPVRRPLPAPTR
jgi:hypothetical protein